MKYNVYKSSHKNVRKTVMHESDIIETEWQWMKWSLLRNIHR